jgi:hypothetical protein
LITALKGNGFVAHPPVIQNPPLQHGRTGDSAKAFGIPEMCDEGFAERFVSQPGNIPDN